VLRGSDEVCVGQGLTEAIAAATSADLLGDEQITDTYCDLNGETYRTEEWGFTLLRLQERFVDAHESQEGFQAMLAPRRGLFSLSLP
jgi:3-oxoacyl-[acyl-carrier-protein] synthase-1